MVEILLCKRRQEVAKSLCFQLPSFLCEGKVADVITPTRLWTFCIGICNSCNAWPQSNWALLWRGENEASTDWKFAKLETLMLPVVKTQRRRKETLKRIAIPVYCICRLPDSGSWMFGCLKWFHAGCVGWCQEIESFNDNWYCSACL